MPETACRRRVLIADDEQVIADTLAMILNAVGFESKAVYSGEGAVSAATLFRPDILLSDIIMAGINGIDAAMIIREMLPECKVIFISGQAATTDFVCKARAEGLALEILAKPVDPQILIEHVKRLAPFARA